MSARQDEGCFHCGLPVPAGSDYGVDIDGERRAMCCPGCQAVAQAIVDGGLTDYYRYRTEEARNAGDLVPAALKELDLYDRPDLQQSFVRVEAENVREASLILEGITCAACVWLNERHVGSLDGVLDFSINYSTHRARLRWDDSRIQLSEVLKAISAIGYIAHPFDPGRQEAIQKRERAGALRRLAVAGLGTMQVMMLAVALYAGEYQGMDATLAGFLRWVSLLLATPVVLYSARPFFVSAWRDLRRRALGMDVPVSLAIGGAYAASVWATVTGTGEIYFDSVTMFTFFLLGARFLEMGARHRAGLAAEELVRLLPAMAARLDEAGGEEMVPVSDLAPGDRVRIRPGDAVPADGRVVEGRSSVDESLLTGESLPLARGEGDAVIGGTVNIESPLVMCVERVGEDTVLSSIQRLLDRAQTEKPAIARLADRVAGWFVAVVLVLATGVGLWWWQQAPTDAFWIVLSVLVVTCPCALSLATPAAITAGTGRLTRLGVVTTRGHALEALSRATHVILDKTGTLTEGRLTLDAVEAPGTLDAERVRAIAATLEQGSEHPVARTLARAGDAGLTVSDVVATPGYGIEGRVEGCHYRLGSREFVRALSGDGIDDVAADADGTPVFLADEDGLQGVFLLGDRPRPGAADTVAALRRAGLEVVLLSGDAPVTVVRVATELGLDRAEGGLTPEAKLARVQALQHAGAVVAMIGDGVNDAPVLAAADVSVAMGGGTQLAHASADMILLSERLPHLVEAVTTARRTLAIIRQNLAWALGYNVVALPLAAAGMIAPWMAAIGMSASSLVVVANALRLTARPRDAEPEIAPAAP